MAFSFVLLTALFGALSLLGVAQVLYIHVGLHECLVIRSVHAPKMLVSVLSICLIRED